MKKIIFALIALVGLAACTPTPKEKMETVIKEHMKNTHVTYEPVKFGEKIDTVYTKMETSKGYQTLIDAFTEAESKCRTSVDAEEMKIYVEAMKKYNALITEYEQNWKPSLVGYSIEHAYKVNDETVTVTFVVDTTLTKVVDFSL